MVAIDGLAEVVLNVHDVPRALAFYQDLLGLERMTPEGQPGPIFFRAGAATDQVPALVVLVPMPAGSPEFAVPDWLFVDTTHLSDAGHRALARAVGPLLGRPRGP